MKRKFLTYSIAVFLTVFFGLSMSAQAQIQKGNVFVGGDIADFNLGLNKGAPFSMTIDPKAAWFIADNFALGAELNLGLQSQTGTSNFNYGIAALARYYAGAGQLEVLKHGKFFAEATFGFAGNHLSDGDFSSNTNGLGFSVGPGYAYFITRNISFEALLKYEGRAGFGNTAYNHDLDLNFGFSIFLPNGQARGIVRDVK